MSTFYFKYTKETCTGHYYYELYHPHIHSPYVPKGICVKCGKSIYGNDFLNLQHMINTYPEPGKMSPETSVEYIRYSNFRNITQKQVQIRQEYTYDI